MVRTCMSLNVSLEASLEEFARDKVTCGDYGSVSDVVRDGLLLLQRREDLWKKEMQAKIEEGVAQCRAGLTVPAEQAWAELKAWRDEQMKALGSRTLRVQSEPAAEVATSGGAALRSIRDLKPISVGKVLKPDFNRAEVWDEMIERRE